MQVFLLKKKKKDKEKRYVVEGVLSGRDLFEFPVLQVS